MPQLRVIRPGNVGVPVTVSDLDIALRQPLEVRPVDRRSCSACPRLTLLNRVRAGPSWQGGEEEDEGEEEGAEEEDGDGNGEEEEEEEGASPVAPPAVPLPSHPSPWPPQFGGGGGGSNDVPQVCAFKSAFVQKKPTLLPALHLAYV